MPKFFGMRGSERPPHPGKFFSCAYGLTVVQAECCGCQNIREALINKFRTLKTMSFSGGKFFLLKKVVPQLFVLSSILVQLDVDKFAHCNAMASTNHPTSKTDVSYIGSFI